MNNFIAASRAYKRGKYLLYVINSEIVRSHVARHSGAALHDSVTVDNFNVIAHNFSRNTHRRKIFETLIIKDLKPSLNVQECSFPLKLL